jgi:hypothetical protein
MRLKSLIWRKYAKRNNGCGGDKLIPSEVRQGGRIAQLALSIIMRGLNM